MISDCYHSSEDEAIRSDPMMGGSAHAVQFYEEDAGLLDHLSEFIGSALGGGRPCVVIATAIHRTELLNRLHRGGLDVQRIAADGRLTLLDAAETLARFTFGSRPDRQLFFEVVGGLLAQAQSSTSEPDRRLALFGEMVALLWAGGKAEDALYLEGLWNELAQKHLFTLLCAYPISCFSREEDQVGFQRICTEHSQLLPCESYSRLKNEPRRLRQICELQQKSKMLEVEIDRRKKAEEDLTESEALSISLIEDTAGTVPVFELKPLITAAANFVYLAKTSEGLPDEVYAQLEGAEQELGKMRQLTGQAHRQPHQHWRN